MKKKSQINIHLIFFLVVFILFAFAFVRLWLWNRGEASQYDPNEDTAHLDIETMDHIQPLSSSRLEGHIDDGITTILCLGNAPFADHKGEGGLAQALAEKVNGIAYDGSFANSFQSLKHPAYQTDYPNDGVSLYHIIQALTSQDFSIMESASSLLSPEAVETTTMLKNLDMHTVDMLVIMYDLSDYLDLRPLYDPNHDSNLVTWSGSLNASLSLLEETYPHIRTVILSTPASGKTIDHQYVDGDTHNFGNGTLPDYLNYQMNVILNNGVSYIDVYYGVINVDNRNEYLTNEYHLNERGIHAVADRFGHFFGSKPTTSS